MDGRKETGNEGEAFTAGWLESRGHRILARNWRAGHLELDIVSLDEEGLHFVEVKTRRPPFQALPQESVTVTKQRRIVKAASAWLARVHEPAAVNSECHFDVASVIIENNGKRMEFIPDAFYPIYM